MIISSTRLVSSSAKPGDYPKPRYPEFAFIGRSNVGKSSLINMIARRKKLAKISGTPGKTRVINHFLINESWYLVDLPGYGFARTPKKLRDEWLRLINHYILERETLLCLFLLIDLRLAPQKIDLAFLEFLGINRVPFAIAFTKSDKLSKLEQDRRLENYRKELLKCWESLPPYFITSAATGTGRNKILDFIDTLVHSSSPE